VTWLRVDDDFASHPKVVGLPLAAVGAWLLAACWSAHHLTDGRLPTAACKRLGIRPADASALVAAGLWERTDDGWQIHDWLAYQPSAASVLQRRAADARRKTAGRQSPTRGVVVSLDRTIKP
jgi:hypothetical protein